MDRLKVALLSGVAVAAVSAPALADSVQSTPRTETIQASARPTGSSASVTTSTPTQPVQAEDEDKAEQAEEPTEDSASQVADVVVSARSDGVRTSIDSISYSLANDLQATTGTLADALRNVPSVDVDPQGNVSLRGNSGVTILVDGQPSALFAGESRAQIIQQIPADRYARIEVMTNPSAAYSPEGSGGIINLISKPSTPNPDAMTMGSVRVNVGDHGRWNVGVGGSYQKDRLTVSGDLSYRYDSNEIDFPRVREALDAQGNVVSTTRMGLESRTEQVGTIGRFSVEYKLTPRTQVTGELRLMKFDIDPESVSYLETDDANGLQINSYEIRNTGVIGFENMGATARLVHRFDDQGHEWSNDLRFDRMDNTSNFNLVTVNQQPVAPSIYERTVNEGVTETLGFTSAYVRPYADNSRLRLGYELSREQPERDVLFSRGPSETNLSPVPSLSNRFQGEQTVHAVYTTYERPLTPKLSVQAGLRLEQADIEVQDITSGLKARQDYFRAYPTGHLQYQLSETQTLRGSFSRRIQRPQLSQLNPFVSYQDNLSRVSGNPNLRPQETDAFEAMWQVRKGQSFYQATLYYRDTDKAFTDVASDIGGGIILTRPENLGGRRDIGLDLSANGRLHSTLRYAAGANLYRQEIDAGGISSGQDREGNVLSGRMSLSWQPTAKDFVQLSGFWQGETLLAQGTREAGGMVNLGYRRKLNEKLSLNVTGRDLFNSFGTNITYDTPAFRERTEQNIKLRAFYIGLSWQLGNNPRRPPEQFDFSSGPT